ncbi:MAG TPA: EamA family transporter [Polyangiaceae bacterium]|nr:EamA family transporter [Polyangiaceae bacterium]
MNWWLWALASAIAAAATAVLAKAGVEGVPSNLATAVRTSVVLVFAWAIAFATREAQGLVTLKGRALLFLLLSGIGTGVSWLAYFKALSLAPASKVAPIDKLSLAFTLVLAALFLGETLSWRVALGAALIVAGALLTLTA